MWTSATEQDGANSWNLRTSTSTMQEWVRTDIPRMASTTASGGSFDAGGTVLLLSSTCSRTQGGVSMQVSGLELESTQHYRFQMRAAGTYLTTGAGQSCSANHGTSSGERLSCHGAHLHPRHLQWQRRARNTECRGAFEWDKWRAAYVGDGSRSHMRGRGAGMWLGSCHIGLCGSGRFRCWPRPQCQHQVARGQLRVH